MKSALAEGLSTTSMTVRVGLRIYIGQCTFGNKRKGTTTPPESVATPVLIDNHRPQECSKRLGRILSERASPHPKCPTQAGTGAVIAPRKSWWRPIVPIAVKRDIPRQIAGDLDVVRSIGVELHSTRIVENREKYSGQVEVGLVEPEQL